MNEVKQLLIEEYLQMFPTHRIYNSRLVYDENGLLLIINEETTEQKIFNEDTKSIPEEPTNTSKDSNSGGGTKSAGH